MSKNHAYLLLIMFTLFSFSGLTQKIIKEFTEYNTSTKVSIPKSFVVDQNDNLWVIDDNKGVNYFNGTNWENYTTTNSGLKSDKIIKIVKSKNNSIWFMSDSTLSVYNGLIWKSYTKDSIGYTGKGNFTSIITDTNNSLYLNFVGYGIVKFDGNYWVKISNKTGTQKGYFTDLWINESDNKLWAYTRWYSKSNVHNITDNDSLVLPDRMGWGNSGAYNLISDNNGNIFVGTLLGIYKYDGKKLDEFSTQTQDDFFDTIIFSVKDKQGNLFFQYVRSGHPYGGMLMYDGVNWRNYPCWQKFGLVNSYFDFLVYDKGKFWASGYLGEKANKIFAFELNNNNYQVQYSKDPNFLRKGDSLTININFNSSINHNIVPQIKLYGENQVDYTSSSKINDSTFSFLHIVEKGNGKVFVQIKAMDKYGYMYDSVPLTNKYFTVLPTLFGDIDTNKIIDKTDALYALKYSVGLDPLPTMDPLPWSNWRCMVANVDTIGKITANDASLILQKYLGLIKEFQADIKKRGGDAISATIDVSIEENNLVFRAKGALYGLNLAFKNNFSNLGTPIVLDNQLLIEKMIESNIYNIGIASSTKIKENIPFLKIPIIGTVTDLSFDIVANTASFTYENGKVSNVASIEMLLEDEIQVFPNPATNFITLKNAVNSTISIIGLNGIEIFNQHNDLNTLNIPLGNNVQRGIYFLRIIDDFGREIATKKIVLE